MATDRTTGTHRDASTALGAASASTATGGSAPRSMRPSQPVDLGLGGPVPEPLRREMQQVARESAGPDEALEPIIGLLVGGGSPQRRAAIATAFRTHDALREQWMRTWELLRT